MLAFLREVYPLLTRQERRRLTKSVVAAVILAALEGIGLGLLFPLVQLLTHPAGSTSELVLRGLPFDVASTMSPAVIGLTAFLAFLLKGILGVIVLRWNISFVLTAEAAAASTLLDAYLRAPYVFHLHHSSADLQRRINDSLRRIHEEGLAGAINAMADGVGIAAIAVILFALQPTVAAFAAAYFVLVGVGYQRLIHGRIHRAGSAMSSAVTTAIAAVQQSLATYKEVTLRGRQRYFVNILSAARRESVSARRAVIVLSQAPRYYLELVLLGGVGLLAAVLFRTRSQPEAVAALGFFLAAGLRFLPALNRVIVGQNMARASVPPLREIAADLQAFPVSSEDSRVVDEVDDETIELVDVTFHHAAQGRAVLREISLRIDPGTTVAFVGRSGAGKTTLIDLILAFADPSAGRITIGGRPLPELRRSWQSRIGYVPQNVVLLDDTLLANIAFGIDEEEVDVAAAERAVREAQLDAVVTGLPEGLRTQIGENGVRLSGGQRQRVGLARAIYHRPSVLVLDEATSALDSDTEARFAQTLRDLRGTMTVIMVAHRLSTVASADRIFFLRDGELVASGTFHELQQSEPEFANLVRLSSLIADQRLLSAEEPSTRRIV